MHERAKKLIRFLVPAMIVLFAVPAITQKEKNKPKALDNEFNCVLCLSGHHPPAVRLSTGFNFEMVRLLGKKMNSAPEIFSSSMKDSVLLYLSRDSIRLAVMPCNDSLGPVDGLICSKVMPDNTVWLTNKNNELLMREFDEWMSDFSKSSAYRQLLARFSPSYEPGARIASGKSFDSAGPYDELVRRHAADIGWDWRLLEALIWKESQFRIDAKSPSGAEGLMQMLPSTARRFSNDDMLDPEKNIKAGVAYLAKIRNMFYGLCDPQDLDMFMLAAYHTGEGKVMDCFRYAKAKGLPCRTWADFEKVLATIRNDKTAKSDTTMLYGGIRGSQTEAYVLSVLSFYEDFKLISPSRSQQDQHATRQATE